ncbi:hypothetical protein NL474_29130, partial [Klebsiella pneumoniae]|nr:hypothetical protein [Klebsiella pneumoniae]
PTTSFSIVGGRKDILSLEASQCKNLKCGVSCSCQATFVTLFYCTVRSWGQYSRRELRILENSP